MNFTFTLDVFWAALGIFGLRLIDMSLDTLRIVFVVRGQKARAWVVGFFQAIVFVVAVAAVISEVSNFWIIIGYASGFATGNIIGMYFSEMFTIGHTHLRVISQQKGEAVAAYVREAGFGVTELIGKGKDGRVELLIISILRKHTKTVSKLILDIDPNAFITAEELKPLRRGFWRA